MRRVEWREIDVGVDVVGARSPAYQADIFIERNRHVTVDFTVAVNQQGGRNGAYADATSCTHIRVY